MDDPNIFGVGVSAKSSVERDRVNGRKLARTQKLLWKSSQRLAARALRPAERNFSPELAFVDLELDRHCLGAPLLRSSVKRSR
jgi:hypothetical protein